MSGSATRRSPPPAQRPPRGPPGARPKLLERPVGPRDADDRPVEMAAPGHRLESREYLLRHDRALRPAREIAAGPLPPRARASRPIAHPAPLRHIAPSPTAGIIERVCARRWRLGGGTGWGPPRSLAPRARAAVPLRPSARAWAEAAPPARRRDLHRRRAHTRSMIVAIPMP